MSMRRIRRRPQSRRRLKCTDGLPDLRPAKCLCALWGPRDNDPRLSRPAVVHEERPGASLKEPRRESEFHEADAVRTLTSHSGAICLFRSRFLGPRASRFNVARYARSERRSTLDPPNAPDGVLCGLSALALFPSRLIWRRSVSTRPAAGEGSRPSKLPTWAMGRIPGTFVSVCRRPLPAIALRAMENSLRRNPLSSSFW